MDITIRKASPEDIDAIVRLNGLLADYHKKIDPYYRSGSETRRVFREHLDYSLRDTSMAILVAEVDGKIRGYCIGVIEGAKSFAVREKIGKISDASVEEEYRRREIGKKMVTALLEWFKEEGVRIAELSVDSRNESGIAAWQTYGFKEYMKKMRLDHL